MKKTVSKQFVALFIAVLVLVVASSLYSVKVSDLGESNVAAIGDLCYKDFDGDLYSDGGLDVKAPCVFKGLGNAYAQAFYGGNAVYLTPTDYTDLGVNVVVDSIVSDEEGNIYAQAYYGGNAIYCSSTGCNDLGVSVVTGSIISDEQGNAYAQAYNGGNALYLTPTGYTDLGVQIVGSSTNRDGSKAHAIVSDGQGNAYAQAYYGGNALYLTPTGYTDLGISLVSNSLVSDGQGNAYAEAYYGGNALHFTPTGYTDLGIDLVTNSIVSDGQGNAYAQAFYGGNALYLTSTGYTDLGIDLVTNSIVSDGQGNAYAQAFYGGNALYLTSTGYTDLGIDLVTNSIVSDGQGNAYAQAFYGGNALYLTPTGYTDLGIHIVSSSANMDDTVDYSIVSDGQGNAYAQAFYGGNALYLTSTGYTDLGIDVVSKSIVSDGQGNAYAQAFYGGNALYLTSTGYTDLGVQIVSGSIEPAGAYLCSGEGLCPDGYFSSDDLVELDSDCEDDDLDGLDNIFGNADDAFFINPGMVENCNDGIDNNCGGTDCANPDCSTNPICIACNDNGVQDGTETGVDCGDGICPACEETAELIRWQNLVGNLPSESQEGDTIIINSSLSDISQGSRRYFIEEYTPILGLPTYSSIEDYGPISSDYSEYLFTNIDVDGSNNRAEFVAFVTDGTIEERTPGELLVDDGESNTPPQVSIELISNKNNPSESVIVPLGGSINVAPNTIIKINASAWDEDDFLNVWLEVDGVLVPGEEVLHFAKIFDPTFSSLVFEYDFTPSGPGSYEICVVVEEEVRDKTVRDCVTIEVLCDGICVNAIISKPIGFINSNWVTFDARESNVQNCSINYFDGADEVADIGTWFCKEVHAPTPNFDPDFNKPELGSEYTLDVQWFIDETPLMPNPISWDSEFSGGYAFIFNKFFPEIRGEHQAKLVLNYTTL